MSTPVTWDEVEAGAKGEDELVFETARTFWSGSRSTETSSPGYFSFVRISPMDRAMRLDSDRRCGAPSRSRAERVERSGEAPDALIHLIGLEVAVGEPQAEVLGARDRSLRRRAHRRRPGARLRRPGRARRPGCRAPPRCGRRRAARGSEQCPRGGARSTLSIAARPRAVVAAARARAAPGIGRCARYSAATSWLRTGVWMSSERFSAMIRSSTGPEAMTQPARSPPPTVFESRVGVDRVGRRVSAKRRALLPIDAKLAVDAVLDDEEAVAAHQLEQALAPLGRQVAARWDCAGAAGSRAP